MGDANTILDEAGARHLLRRSGFPATRRELVKAKIVGLTRRAAADKILGFKPKVYRPNGRDQRRQHDNWVHTLLRTKTPAQEKLVLFWHDHFATGIAKLLATRFDLATKLMAAQNKLLRVHAHGNMKDLVKAIGKDAAMMEFLDTSRNEKSVPNENYARELLELFTLGVYDSAGNPNYTQQDIVQIARAFTGWRYDRQLVAYLDHGRHDFSAEYLATRGPKRIFETTGNIGGADFDANGEGEPEIDTVDIIFTHTDSDGHNTVARHTARRLLEFYVGPEPSLATIDQVIAESGFTTTWSIRDLVRAIFCHDDFYATGQPFGPGVTKSVKWPIDFAIGSLRLLGMKLYGKNKLIPGGSRTQVFTHLQNMGQTVLDPPSVFGWDWETAWLSSSTLLARYNFARDIVASRSVGRFRPERLIDMRLTDPAEIVEQVLDVLDVAHNFTAADRQVCVDYLTDGGTLTPDLSSDFYVNKKLRGLFELVMKSPGYQVY